MLFVSRRGELELVAMLLIYTLRNPDSACVSFTSVFMLQARITTVAPIRYLARTAATAMMFKQSALRAPTILEIA